ncbi:hypothetical protein FJ987_16450 [Mesorhizobium sp. CU2]|uniref:hypothetical protein n=1 Tax=unclassified Mesorhizobium TaxID=325217 RepID=UPI00112E42B6|nr:MULTISPECIES: hypothetical protein [unclassified Mesorhizobium]TPN82559.1 hypothetical protein FJ988_15500 [Mesorhizobium sp. CU3]TPO12764.1 hypothetical protein FJ987_16450 [Mesorhizobium sp. CU2]
MDKIGNEDMRRRAVDLVMIVEPEDAFVVEEGFDDIVDNWHKARPQDEGKFIGGAEVASFAALVIPFLLGFFGNVAKDQAQRASGALLDKVLGRTATEDESTRLKSEIELAIVKSKFSSDQKAVLIAGFGNLFARVQPSK